MKTNNYKIVLGALFTLLLASCSPRQLAPQQFLGFNFTEKTAKVILPFKIVNNLVIVPLFINNSDTLRFILDTGVKVALITEMQVEEAFDVKEAKPQKIKGLGDGEELDALLIVDNSFRISSLYGQHHDLLILLEDIFFLSTRLNTRVNGLVGYDVFKNFPVEIDYQSRKIIFHNPKKRLQTRGFQAFDLTIEGGKPYITAQVEIEKGRSVPVKLLIDTGASHSLSLELNDEKGISLPPKTIDAYLGKGLSGDLEGKIGRIGRVKIGKYTFEDVPTSYPDTASMGGFYGIAGRNGSLGSNIVKRFRVIFDYPNGKIYLKPNRDLKKPFYPNLAGLEFNAPIPGLKYYVISQVTPNMPAAKVGLKVGDELLGLNGQMAASYEINDINELLHSRPGKKINIRIKRNGEVLRFSFELSDPTDFE